jgi:hypothetical protein
MICVLTDLIAANHALEKIATFLFAFVQDRERLFRGMKLFEGSVYDDWIEGGARQFKLTDKEDEADYALFPFDLGRCPRDEAFPMLNAFCQRAAVSGLRTLAFNEGETRLVPPNASCILFQPNLERTTRLVNEFALPRWMCDMTKEYKNDSFAPIRYGKEPSVEFRGNDAGLKDWKTPRARLKRLMAALLRMHGRRFQKLHVRARALEVLRGFRRCERCVTTSTQHWVGFRVWRGEVVSEQDIIDSHRAYFADIERFQYHLCVRGTANFSFRLYEVMSAGRIPLFVNTDCVLPLETLIPWKELCVWIEDWDLQSMESNLIKRHRSVSAQEFEEWQRRIYDFWRTYLRPEAFFVRMFEELEANTRTSRRHTGEAIL